MKRPRVIVRAARRLPAYPPGAPTLELGFLVALLALGALLGRCW